MIKLIIEYTEYDSFKGSIKFDDCRFVLNINDTNIMDITNLISPVVSVNINIKNITVANITLKTGEELNNIAVEFKRIV